MQRDHWLLSENEVERGKSRGVVYVCVNPEHNHS